MAEEIKKREPKPRMRLVRVKHAHCGGCAFWDNEAWRCTGGPPAARLCMPEGDGYRHFKLVKESDGPASPSGAL